MCSYSGQSPRTGARIDATTRLRAVQASRSAAELSAAVHDPSPEVARAALQRLAALNGTEAIPLLRARLLESESWLVADIAKKLQMLGDQTVVERAFDGLSDRSYSHRVRAALALGACGDARAAAALGDALGDEIAAVRIAALRALGALGPDKALATALRSALSDPDPQVRIAAVRTTARCVIGARELLANAAADGDPRVRVELVRHLSRLPKQTATALLEDREAEVRAATARGAGREHAAQLALILTADANPEVRHAAAQTLGTLGDPRIAESLVPGIEDPDALVRAAVLRALERLSTRPRAVTRLSRELSSPCPVRRRAALYGLARLGGIEADADAARLVHDENPEVRLALIHTADTLLRDPERAVQFLTCDADPGVRDSAAMWLLRRRRPAIADA
jgi:HEAT repeat protein